MKAFFYQQFLLSADVVVLFASHHCTLQLNQSEYDFPHFSYSFSFGSKTQIILWGIKQVNSFSNKQGNNLNGNIAE